MSDLVVSSQPCLPIAKNFSLNRSLDSSATHWITKLGETLQVSWMLEEFKGVAHTSNRIHALVIYNSWNHKCLKYTKLKLFIQNLSFLYKISCIRNTSDILLSIYKSSIVLKILNYPSLVFQILLFRNLFQYFCDFSVIRCKAVYVLNF